MLDATRKGAHLQHFLFGRTDVGADAKSAAQHRCSIQNPRHIKLEQVLHRREHLVAARLLIFAADILIRQHGRAEIQNDKRSLGRIKGMAAGDVVE